jgi:hypothetical protein
MKTISIQLPDHIYQAVTQYAQDHNQSAAQVVVEAVNRWRLERQQAPPSLLSLPPLDLGPMRPLADDDLLGEMLDDSRP